MARKLFVLVALVSLVAMTQAAPGVAATYDLVSEYLDWVETFPVTGNNDYTPGSEGSTLSGWNEWDKGAGFWLIGGEYTKIDGNYVINSPVMVTTRDGGSGEPGEYGIFYTFVYTYDQSVLSNEVRFTADIPGGPSIKSYDAEFEITATYKYEDAGPVPWTFQYGTMEGGGTEWLTGTPFALSADVYVDNGNHTQQGHYENFQLTYPASSVPIPGAVWLLGTGVLGLLCLGRRRKK